MSWDFWDIEPVEAARSSAGVCGDDEGNERDEGGLQERKCYPPREAGRPRETIERLARIRKGLLVEGSAASYRHKKHRRGVNDREGLAVKTTIN
jgi:hypothetical protein